MATPQETTTPPPASTVVVVVAIPTPTLEIKGTDVSSETTVPSLSSKAIDRENLRQKLQPLLLYVVSTAQFLDVGRSQAKTQSHVPTES